MAIDQHDPAELERLAELIQLTIDEARAMRADTSATLEIVRELRVAMEEIEGAMRAVADPADEPRS